MTLLEIWAKAQVLEAKVLRDGGTDRDVAEAAELASKYIDELKRLEETATVMPYLSADAVADKVLSYWSYNG